MHTQARFFIRTALAHLVAAFLIGATVLFNQALEIDGRIGALQPVFYHLLMVGWITQLICGVSLWMFPPFSRERPRGDERLGWLAYGAKRWPAAACRVRAAACLVSGGVVWLDAGTSRTLAGAGDLGLCGCDLAAGEGQALMVERTQCHA